VGDDSPVDAEVSGWRPKAAAVRPKRLTGASIRKRCCSSARIFASNL